jgi:hypothetical protein
VTDDSNLLLAERLKQRAEFGLAKYGVALKPWDKRNTVIDAIEEVLDLAVYLQKLAQERAEVAEFLYSMAETCNGHQLYVAQNRCFQLAERLTADIPRIGSRSEAEETSPPKTTRDTVWLVDDRPVDFNEEYHYSSDNLGVRHRGRLASDCPICLREVVT